MSFVLDQIITFTTQKVANMSPQKNILLEKVKAGIGSDFSKERAHDMFVKSNEQKNLKTNFENEKKFSILRDFIFEYGEVEPQLADNLYQNQYLPNIDKKMAKILGKIHKRFGTKVFIMDEAKIIDANFIYKELEAYGKASKGKARFPNAIEVTTLKDFKCKKFTASGTAYYWTNNISINGTDNLEWVLRHELMHLNDKPYSELYNAFLVMLIKRIQPLKNKLMEQFSKAGIGQEHIPYAFTNADEFVAVAAEGDMKVYNKPFKILLRCFGLPKWGFKLEENPIVARKKFKSDLELKRTIKNNEKILLMHFKNKKKLNIDNI